MASSSLPIDFSDIGIPFHRTDLTDTAHDNTATDKKHESAIDLTADENDDVDMMDDRARITGGEDHEVEITHSRMIKGKAKAVQKMAKCADKLRYITVATCVVLCKRDITKANSSIGKIFVSLD